MAPTWHQPPTAGPHRSPPHPPSSSTVTQAMDRLQQPLAPCSPPSPCRTITPRRPLQWDPHVPGPLQAPLSPSMHQTPLPSLPHPGLQMASQRKQAAAGRANSRQAPSQLHPQQACMPTASSIHAATLCLADLTPSISQELTPQALRAPMDMPLRSHRTRTSLMRQTVVRVLGQQQTMTFFQGKAMLPQHSPLTARVSNLTSRMGLQAVTQSIILRLQRRVGRCSIPWGTPAVQQARPTTDGSSSSSSLSICREGLWVGRMRAAAAQGWQGTPAWAMGPSPQQRRRQQHPCGWITAMDICGTSRQGSGPRSTPSLPPDPLQLMSQHLWRMLPCSPSSDTCSKASSNSSWLPSAAQREHPDLWQLIRPGPVYSQLVDMHSGLITWTDQQGCILAPPIYAHMGLLRICDGLSLSIFWQHFLLGQQPRKYPGGASSLLQRLREHQAPVQNCRFQSTYSAAAYSEELLMKSHCD